VKQIVPFVHLIHSVDSIRLLNTIQSEAQKLKRTIAVLLQLHIAKEDSKFGFTSAEVRELLIGDFRAEYPNVRLRGMMGMATFTEDREQIRQEFLTLKKLYDEFQNTYEFDTLSMGMSNDYHLALECGSTMLRIGSKIFE
jgi:pyridoxal phosphate enzyme (YggS family)